MELKKEIRMEDVSYTYPESDKVILDHAQMLVPVGKSVGVMGPSGAGKEYRNRYFNGTFAGTGRRDFMRWKKYF